MTTAWRSTFAASVGVGAAIALYACGDARPIRASGAASRLDPDVVAVLPFSVQGSQSSLSDLRDAIQDLVSARLPGGDGTPRALAPATVLGALRRAAPSPDDVVPTETSMRVAAKLGAGQLLRGTVSGTAGDLTMEAELVAVPAGAVRARATVQGDADSLPHLADRLVARLLAVQAARDSGELAALSATSLPALRAYLAGQQAYRRGRGGVPSEARQQFERALFLDSTFAPAGLRLAELAAVYGMSGTDERWKLAAIWKERDRLGPGDRALLDAYLGPRYPRPATLAELIAAGEQAAVAAPHRREAWHIAGVNLLRFGSMIGYPAWETWASAALRRALALDSTDAFTLQYLLRLAAGVGDSAAVRRYARLYFAHDSAAYNAEFIRWLAALVLDDGAALEAVRSRLAEMHRFNLRAMVDWSVSYGIGLEDAERAARFYDEGATTQRRSVVEAIAPFLLNRGRPVAASRLLTTEEQGFGLRQDVGVLEFRVYAALFWNGDLSEAAAAARSLEAYLHGAPGRSGQIRDPQTASCALAHWRLAAGDLAGAEVVLARMRRLGADAGSPPIESTPVCAAAAEAQLAAAGHRTDAAAVLARLDTLLRAGSDVRQLLPSVATVIAARLYEQRGDLVYALALMRRRTSWVNQLLSTQLREEGRLAALVGDTAGAIRAYRHYVALRSDPEPRLRPGVERVRADLQGLERLSRGP